MRIAIISDIHSNLEALTKAFEIIDTKNVDEIVCLGDIVGYGANPNECVELIKKRVKYVVIGNHDYAVAVDPNELLYFSAHARESDLWTRDEIYDQCICVQRTASHLNLSENANESRCKQLQRDKLKALTLCKFFFSMSTF